MQIDLVEMGGDEELGVGKCLVKGADAGARDVYKVQIAGKESP